MEVKPGFNPVENRITLEFKTELLKEYFPNFLGIVKRSPDIPEGTKVAYSEEGTAIISFPCPSDAINKSIGEDKGILMLNGSDIDIFKTLIHKFINGAMNKKMKTTEFIPLNGYPIENLQTEICQALENKRDFCILNDFSEYENMKQNDYVFEKAAKVDFGTFEYAQTAILVRRGDIKSLKKMWESKLHKQVWI